MENAAEFVKMLLKLLRHMGAVRQCLGKRYAFGDCIPFGHKVSLTAYLFPKPLPDYTVQDGTTLKDRFWEMRDCVVICIMIQCEKRDEIIVLDVVKGMGFSDRKKQNKEQL